MRIPNLNLPGQPRRKRRIGKRTTGVGLVVAIVVALIAAWNQRQGGSTSGQQSGARGGTAQTSSAARSDASSREKATSKSGGASGVGDCAGVIKAALDAQRSDVLIECSGDIIKVLDDDNEGSRHQRFLVKLNNGVVIKVSHNIDLAPRVPAQKGDRIEFKGEFEWNDLGGVVHWTHHDPRNRREGGWIRFDGETYE
jgi:hypothetical protein